MSSDAHADRLNPGGTFSPALIRRLGLNRDGYRGDVIDITQVLQEVEKAAQLRGWASDPFETEDGLLLQGWVRRRANANARLYLSTGIHGDEPAGPLAAKTLIEGDTWPEDVEVWFCPCLNPTGFAQNRRENRHGIDLNRQYLHVEATEVRAHIAWLSRQPSFTTALCLHEDWESHGFYLYELNPDGQPSLSEPMIQGVSEVCPIDLSPIIEDRPAQGGIIRPNLDPASRPQWPESFYLLTHKTRHSYTLEAPSDFPLQVRVQALARAVQIVAKKLSRMV